MAAPTLIVNVVITKQTRVVSQFAFGVPAIFGPSNRIVGAYQVYNTSDQMLVANGGPFQSSDPEYIEAAAMMSQAIKPQKFVVSKFTAAVAQVDTLAVNTVTVGHQYKFTLNSVVISYTAIGGDTQQSILAALLTAIGVAFPTNPPVSGAVTGVGAGALLTLTSSTAGAGVSYTSVDALLTEVNVTPNHSIADDILTCQNAVLSDAQFYGVIVTSHAKNDILQVAAYIETQLLVYLTASADADCLTNVTTDVMSQLKGKSYDRSMCLYSAQANTNGPDGAWMGYMLPTQPGVGNWAMKTLVGVDADNLNPTQIANVISKNGNVYVTIGGNGTTLYGIAAGGEFFDVTIFLDWVATRIQEGIIAVETSPLNLKVPYSNQGIAMLTNPIKSVCQQGQDFNGFLPGWSVFSPDATSVPAADRANRVLNNIGFNAELAGAINKISVQGYVSA